MNRTVLQIFLLLDFIPLAILVGYGVLVVAPIFCCFLANNVLAKRKERAVNTLLPCYLMFWELLWASVSGRALNHLSLFIFDDFL